MLWPLAAIVIFTLMSFRAAMIASEIIVIVHGTSTQSALEEQCKQTWYRPESFLGYHPLNHRLWLAIVNYPAMPAEALGKQRALRTVVAIQTTALIAAMVAMMVASWLT